MTTLAATAITVGTATLNASVNPNGSSTDTSFQYSLDPTLPANIVTTLAGSPGQSGRAEGLTSPLGAGRCHDAQRRRNQTPVNSGEAACRHSRPKVGSPSPAEDAVQSEPAYGVVRRGTTRCPAATDGDSVDSAGLPIQASSLFPAPGSVPGKLIASRFPSRNRVPVSLLSPL